MRRDLRFSTTIIYLYYYFSGTLTFLKNIENPLAQMFTKYCVSLADVLDSHINI